MIKKEIEEVKEEDSEEGEDLEEIIEGEYFDEVDNFRLQSFLMNQQKDVSLDQVAVAPIVNLETDLPSVRPSLEEEKENIEYNLFSGLEEGKYISSSGVTIDNPHWNDEERKIEEQKRLYENPRKLRGDILEKEDLGMKYVRAEDTARTDYVMKKRFGE